MFIALSFDNNYVERECASSLFTKILSNRPRSRFGLSINGQRGNCNKRGGDQSKRASVYHKAPPLLDHSPIRLCQLSREVLPKAPSGHRLAYPSFYRGVSPPERHAGDNACLIAAPPTSWR
jgi:hypothetical protein